MNPASKLATGVKHSSASVSPHPGSPQVAAIEPPVSTVTVSEAPSAVAAGKPKLLTRIAQVYHKHPRLIIYGAAAGVLLLIFVPNILNTVSRFDKSYQDASDTDQKMADHFGAEAKDADAKSKQYQERVEQDKRDADEALQEGFSHRETARKQLASAMTGDPLLVGFLDRHPDLEWKFKGVVNGSEDNYHSLQLTMISLSAGGNLSLSQGNHIGQLLDECFK